MKTKTKKVPKAKPVVFRTGKWTGPKYWVFLNGVSIKPNDLMAFPAALARFKAVVAENQGKPRTIVNLYKAGWYPNAKRLRQFLGTAWTPVKRSRKAVGLVNSPDLGLREAA